jgi:hypothetical protein
VAALREEDSSAAVVAGEALVAEAVVRPAPVGARKESSDRGLGDACMWQGAVEHGSPSLHYRVSALGA